MKKTIYSFLFYLLATSHLMCQTFKTNGYPDFRVDSCYFDGGDCSLMRSIDSGSVWEIGIPTKPWISEAYSPLNALITDDSAAYSKGLNDYVQFDIPTVGYEFGNMYVEFWHKYQLDSLLDFGKITLAFDSSEYLNVSAWADSAYIQYFDNLSLEGNIFDIDSGVTGTSDWGYGRIFIRFYTFVRQGRQSSWVHADTLHLRFYMVSDSIDSGNDGWAIDNVVVGDYYASEITDEQPLSLKIFPDPVKDFVYLYSGELARSSCNINVIDLRGNMVIQIPLIFTDDGNLKISTDGLPPGPYIIRAENDSHAISGEFIKL